MDKVKKYIVDLPLKQALTVMVLGTVLIITGLSGITIGGCLLFRAWLLPDSNMIYLSTKTTYPDGTEIEEMVMLEIGAGEQELPVLVSTDMEQENPGQAAQEESEGERGQAAVRYSVERVDNSYTSLTPRRKFAYMGASAAMVLLPFLYSVAGILLCGLHFYRWKLERPIGELDMATEHISGQNLDFTVDYDSRDEMGALCRSFEKMRRTLSENYKALWSMLEERRLLQASVAHDLRNPIAIIQGYAEYLALNYPDGRLGREQVMDTVANLQAAARRLERYTDSIRDVNHLEEMEVSVSDFLLPELTRGIGDELRVLAEKAGLRLTIKDTVPEVKGRVDMEVLYRILENLLSNALRYAREQIELEFSLEGDFLDICLRDDGPGFPEEILKKSPGKYFLTGETSEEHMGLGLTVSRILCKKHGGALQIANGEAGGATVKIRIWCGK